MFNTLNPRWAKGLAAFGFLFLVSVVMMKTGFYGWTLFALIPVAMGAVAEFFVKSESTGRAVLVGMLANALGSLLFIGFGIEGLICVLVSWPLILPLGALGGWLAHSGADGPATMFLLLPLSAGTLGWDVTAKPPLFEVRSSVEIAAPPETVWKYVTSFPPLREPDEWYFKSGLAYPVRARLGGSTRYCDFSTGSFVEPIEILDAPRLLRFKVTESPAPMREWGLYGDVSPRHLHGYFNSRMGEFRLTALPGGRTLLEGTSRYEHGLWPAAYWRWWSDAIIHRIHMRVLRHIKGLAEG